MVSEPLPSLRWGSVHKPMRVASGHSLGRQEWGDPIRIASGDAGPQEELIVMFYSAWYGSEDVLICIFASFLAQRILKPSWP
jgi:hypothetical protein